MTSGNCSENSQDAGSSDGQAAGELFEHYLLLNRAALGVGAVGGVGRIAEVDNGEAAVQAVCHLGNTDVGVGRLEHLQTRRTRVLVADEHLHHGVDFVVVTRRVDLVNGAGTVDRRAGGRG